MNDGSTDASQAILDEYAAQDSRVKVLVQENSGQAVARNRALDVAQGDWISCIDSDDWLDSDAYAGLLEEVEDDVDVICFWHKTEEGVTENEQGGGDTSYRQRYKGVYEVTAPHVMASMTVVSNKLLRRSLVEQYAIRFPEGKKYEDAAFHYCIMSVARKISYHPEKLCYHYVQRGDSTMHVSWQKHPMVMDHLYVCDNIFEFLQKHGKLGVMHEALEQFLNRTFYFCRDNLPENLMGKFHEELSVRVCQWGLKNRCDLQLVQEFRKIHIGRIEYLFHRCYPTHDSYGLFGFSAVSVVHKPEKDDYYVLGRRLFSRFVFREKWWKNANAEFKS